jgi:hypothetical protein
LENLLGLVPSFKRQLGMYQSAKDTDSTLAAYLADATEALQFRWSRTYVISFIAPNSYSVDPTIVSKDKRPIILMASIIYKMGNISLASFRDQDFSYDPKGSQNPIQGDITELATYLPKYRLAKAVTAPLHGFNNMFSSESYNRLIYGALNGADNMLSGGAAWEWYNLL